MRGREAQDLAAALAARVGSADIRARARRYGVPERLSGSPALALVASRLAEDLRALGASVREERTRALTSRPGRALVRLGSAIYPGVAAAFSAPAADRHGPAIPGAPGTEAGWLDRVVVHRGPPTPERVALAQAAGAAALVHLVAEGAPPLVSVSPVRGSPTPWTVGNLPGLPVACLSGEVAEAFAARLTEVRAADARGPRVSVTAGVDTRWREIPIVTADVGPVGAAGFVLASAPLDAWLEGGMDAAALASLVELAAAAGVGPAPRLGLRLALWAGSGDGSGAGAQAYADRHWSELAAGAAVHLACSAVGGRGRTDLTRIGALPESRFLVAGAVRAVAGQAYVGSPLYGRVDHAMWSIGVPSAFDGLGGAPSDPAAGGTPGGPDDTVERLDGTLAARDAAVFAHAVGQALHGADEPIDLVGGAVAVADLIEDWQRRLAGRLDLSEAAARAGDLADAARRFAAAGAGRRAGEERRRVAARSAGRLLVRVHHSTGGRFDHDPVVGIGPVPGLTALETLVEAAPGSAPEDLARIAARRATTAVAVTLGDAAARLERRA